MSEAIGLISRALNFLWSRPILKDTITTTAFTVIGRSVGFLIPFFIAAWYGIGSETDAFFFAYGAIFFLTQIFSNVVSSVIVPFVAEARAVKEDLGKIIGSLLVASFLGILGISVIFALSGYYLFRLITGFDPTQLQLVYWLSLETLPIILLVVTGNLIGGVLNAHSYFATPLLTLGLRSIVTLIFILVFRNSLGIHALPFGYIVGELVRTIYLYNSVTRLDGVVVKFLMPNRASLDFIKTASIQMIGLAVDCLNPIMNRIMASWLAVGSVSLLEYAHKLFFIPLNLFGEGLFIVLLSYWSNRTYSGQSERLKRDVIKTIKLVTAFSVPVTLGLFVLQEPFVKLAYGWGVFPKARIDELSVVFGMFILGIVPRLISVSFARGLLVLKDTFSLAKFGIIKTFLTVVINLVLLSFMGLKGIALGTSVVEFLGAFFLWNFFNKTFEFSQRG